MSKIIGYQLIILGIIMNYLSFRIGGLPPGITGISFIAIGIVFINPINNSDNDA